MPRYYQSNYESPGSWTHIIFSKKNRKKHNTKQLENFIHPPFLSSIFPKQPKRHPSASPVLWDPAVQAFCVYHAQELFGVDQTLYQHGGSEGWGCWSVGGCSSREKSHVSFCFPGMLGWDLNGVGVGGNNEFVVGKTKGKNQRKWKGSSWQIRSSL